MEKKDTQQRRSFDHQTCSQNRQDTHHRGEQPTVELVEIRIRSIQTKKTKVNWPKANVKESYQKFDTEVEKLVARFKGFC